MIEVIKCPTGICICNVKCTSSYDKSGNRIPVRKSLPYQGIARRALNGESIDSIIESIIKKISKCPVAK